MAEITEIIFKNFLEGKIDLSVCYFHLSLSTVLQVFFPIDWENLNPLFSHLSTRRITPPPSPGRWLQTVQIMFSISHVQLALMSSLLTTVTPLRLQLRAALLSRRRRRGSSRPLIMIISPQVLDSPPHCSSFNPRLRPSAEVGALIGSVSCSSWDRVRKPGTQRECVISSGSFRRRG